MGVEISDDGQSAIVNGQQVARSGVDPVLWGQIESAAGAGGRAGAQRAQQIAGNLSGGAPPAAPTAAPVSQPRGSGSRGARRAASAQQAQQTALAATQPAPDPTQVGQFTPADVGDVAPGDLRTAEQAAPVDPGLAARIAAAAPPQAAAAPATGPSFQRVTTTNQQQTGIVGGEELRERASDLAEDQQNLAIDAAAHRVKESDERAEALANEVVARDRAAAEQASIRQEWQDESERQMGAIREKQAQVTQLEQAGHDFWADKGASGRVMAILGATFGGLQAGLQGGANQFLEYLDGMMAREERAHQQKVDGLRQDVKGATTYHDIARLEFDDQIAQSKAAQLMQLENIQAQLRKRIEGLGDSQAALDMGQAVAAIEEKKIATQQQLADRVTTNTAQKMVRVKPRPGAGGIGSGPAAAGQQPFRGAEVVDPGVWNNLKPVAKEKARERVSAYNNLLSQAEELVRLREEHGTDLEGSEAESKVVALMEGMAGNASTARGQGVLTGEEKPAFMKTIGGGISPKASDIWRAFGRDETLNRIKASRDVFKAEANNLVQGFGLKIEGTDLAGERVKGAQAGFQ